MAGTHAAASREFRNCADCPSRPVRIQRARACQRFHSAERSLIMQTEILPYISEPRKDTGLYNAKVGIWLFLASEVMLFGALFSTYILLRVGADEGTWPHGWLNIPLGTANTLVLITSSITTVLAWASLKMKNFSGFKMWHAITILCALIFMGIKSVEYRDKFMHYSIQLTDGRIADGHLIKKSADFDLEKKTGEVEIHGRYGKDLKEFADLRRGEGKEMAHHHEEIKIPAAQITHMENYG